VVPMVCVDSHLPDAGCYLSYSAGVWTRKLKGEQTSDDEYLQVVNCQPTPAHQAFVQLYRANRLHYIGTTNCDGLHLKSGFPREALSELHGNSFVEECSSCLARYERDYAVRTATGLFEHETGSLCDACGGPLRDVIVNFGNTFEHVPSMEAEHDRAWMEMKKADLVVVLGSSLSVETACDLPEECIPVRYGRPNGGRMVIVNLQPTPKDELAALQISATCDAVMTHIANELLTKQNL